MKKILLLCFLLACSLGVSYAQNTTVTATVVDSDGTTWANGKWSIAWTPGPSNPNINAYTNNGAKLSNSVAYQSGTLNGSGAFSVTVYDSSVTFPTGSGWALSVCSNTSAPCSTYNFATAGGSQDISAALTANIAAPRFKAVSGTYGYADTEATLSVSTGATYWNVTSGISRCYSGSAWGTCSASSSNATTVNGGTIPPSQSCIGTNVGGQFIGGTCTGGNAFVSCSNSGADQTAINLATAAAIAGTGPSRVVLGGGTCLLTGHITVGSPNRSTTLDWSGTTLNYPQSSPDNSITNTAQGAAAQRSFADAVTVAGSSTITSAALASFTSADIGQTLRCAGAYGSGGVSPGETLGTDFWTRIANVNSATSITTDDPMAVSLNPTTCYIYARDRDINLIGDGGRIFQSGVDVATSNPIILIQSANRLYMRGVATADGTSLTTVSITGGKNVMLRDVRDVEVDNLNVNGWQILQDGIDIYGPARNVTVAHMRGQSGDDFTSVSSIGGGISNVFQNPLGIQGVVDNVHIIDAVGCSYANEHGTQSFGPQGTPLPMTNLYFDISGAACGNGNGFSIGGLFDQGYFEGLTAKISGYYTGYGVSLRGITGGNMRFDINAPIAPNASPYHAGGILLQVIQPGYSPSTPTNIENLEASYYAADHNTTYLYYQDASATVHQQKHHVQVGNFSGGVFSPFWILGGFDDFLADGQINYNSASTSTCIICLTGTNVAPTGAAVGGVVHDRLNITHQSGSAAAGSHIYLTPLSTFNPTLVHADVSGASDMPLDTTARLDNLIFVNGAGATLGSYTIENSRVDHINTCFFNSGGTLSGTGTIFNNVTTNMTVPASCAPYVPNSPTVVAAPAVLTNQTSSLSTATVAYTSTSANQRVQWTCDLSTGSATGTGTVSTQSTIDNYTNYNLSPTMTFSAHNYLHWSAVFDMGVSGTVLKYGTTYVAGSGGNYNLSCTAVRLQ